MVLRGKSKWYILYMLHQAMIGRPLVRPLVSMGPLPVVGAVAAGEPAAGGVVAPGSRLPAPGREPVKPPNSPVRGPSLT